MSRIGNKEILIPEKVTAILDGDELRVKGELGEQSVKIRPEIKVEISEGKIKLARINESKIAKSLHGLTRSLIFNAVDGVNRGYQKDLEIVGVGYRAQVEENKLKLKIGYSYEVEITPKEGISFEVKKNIISIKGVDKQLVGQTAAEIRALKKPEPYKGKGIKYVGEKIIRKVGKAVKSAGTGA